jgi:hypothetical protein
VKLSSPTLRLFVLLVPSAVLLEIGSLKTLTKMR